MFQKGLNLFICWPGESGHRGVNYFQVRLQVIGQVDAKLVLPFSLSLKVGYFHDYNLKYKPQTLTTHMSSKTSLNIEKIDPIPGSTPWLFGHLCR